MVDGLQYLVCSSVAHSWPVSSRTTFRTYLIADAKVAREDTSHG